MGVAHGSFKAHARNAAAVLGNHRVKMINFFKL